MGGDKRLLIQPDSRLMRLGPADLARSLQERIVSHLKDLIHICLELEDQYPSRALKIAHALSNNSDFTS